MSAFVVTSIHHLARFKSQPLLLRPPSPPPLPPSSLNMAADLRHMTSASALVSPTRSAGQRASQHLLGSRSPNSIPSSPTSIRSSSSAIFERDIEPIMPPSPPHTTNPHRIARSNRTEALEHAVPSVLDSAAAVLATLDDTTDLVEQVSVVAPVAQSPGLDYMGRSNSGFASPIGSFRSRSPSPVGSRNAGLLLNIPHPPSSVITSPQSVLGLTTSPSGSSSYSPPRPQIKQSDTITQISALAPSIGAPVDYSSPIDPYSSDPTAITSQEHHRPGSTHGSPRLYQPQSQQSLHPSPSPLTSPLLSSSPPSPVHVAKKRLSFMSYSDLISSTPASTQPLSSLTTSASTAEPPPHIPSVSGLNIASAIQAHAQGQTKSATPSLRNVSISMMSAGVGAPMGGITHPGMRENIALLDNVGGEWERQGLGRGLEERLEALVLPPAMDGPIPAVAPAINIPTVDGGKA
ncbi:hypothetical protein D9619_010210 [Psilocybe cf. subviscida]|uniref:Uncharacterized protein n=1 Tax=Psilocybe cf. subviscida TaxID=2480587 RepID=A0A8H5ASN9_9AGAR|nr:hypothetical protein D9619_010210 [Psilocybe cf. subviscida]